MRRITVLICVVALTTVVFAQDKPAAAPSAQEKPAVAPPSPEGPFSAFNKEAYSFLKSVLLRSAEKMPEESYNFKPTDAVRSFAQVLGHVADSQYYFCSAARGEANPSPKVEQTKSTKADLIAALKEVFAYCDKAYDTMTDAAVSQTVKVMASEKPKPLVLSINNLHAVEHYGNIITYLRLKNIVPPSSERPPQAKKPGETGSQPDQKK